MKNNIKMRNNVKMKILELNVELTFAKKSI